MLPDVDGQVFADELGRRGLRPGIPIIMISADSDIEEKAEKIGAEGCFQKPVRLAAVLGEVARLLQA
jgi:CheY-like chemotaxis protein